MEDRSLGSDSVGRPVQTAARNGQAHILVTLPQKKRLAYAQTNAFIGQSSYRQHCRSPYRSRVALNVPGDPDWTAQLAWSSGRACDAAGASARARSRPARSGNFVWSAGRGGAGVSPNNLPKRPFQHQLARRAARAATLRPQRHRRRAIAPAPLALLRSPPVHRRVLVSFPRALHARMSLLPGV